MMLEVNSFSESHQNTGPIPMQANNVYRHYPTQGVQSPEWTNIRDIQSSEISDPDKQSTLVHWTLDGPRMTGTVNTTHKSDEEEEEYRPFTPPQPRERLSYTRYQLDLLNGIFAEVRYPNSTQKHLIGKRVGITRDQVKIWFQNRRRKDVIGTAKPKSCDSAEDKAEADSTTCDPKDKSPSSPSTVPPMVMSSIIGELIKYKNEPAKPSKFVKKSKSKKKSKVSETGKSKTNPTNDALDIFAPPNEVTPNAYVSGPNAGFRHAFRTSAFDAPKDYTRVPPVFSSVTESFGSRGFGTCYEQNSDFFNTHANSRMNYTPTYSRMPTTATIEHRPVYSENLNQLPQPSFLYSRNNVSEPHTPQCHIAPSSDIITVPRVHPVPFVAEPPVRLSDIKHRNYNLPYSNFPASGSIEETAQEVRISSVNNSFYMPHLHMAAANAIHNSTYTQL